jgi:hypothetical protein
MPAPPGICGRHPPIYVAPPAKQGFMYNFARLTPVRDLHVTFKVSYVLYNKIISKRHIKWWKKLRDTLGGAEAYDRSAGGLNVTQQAEQDKA